MSVTLKNLAQQLRGLQNGNLHATAISQAASEIDAIHTQVDPFINPAGSSTMKGNSSAPGFSRSQTGGLFIDTFAIRNLTARYDFEDCPDIQVVTAVGYRVPLLGRWMRLNNTSGGSLTLTSTPTVALAVSNGQKQELFNISANNIVIQDNGTLAGSKLRLQATTRTLKQGGSISLRWNTDLGFWYEQWFSSPV